MIRASWICVLAFAAATPLSLAAQSGPGGSQSREPAGSNSGPGGGRAGALTPEQRQAIREERRANAGEKRGPGQHPVLEQLVRQRFAAVVRTQLQLDDQQMRRLGEVSRKFEGRRRELNVRERSAREVLRSEVHADRNADNPRVATALQEVLTISRERSGILGEEDQELSAFLTPVQRARWFALQDQLRRRVEEMRRNAAAGLDPAAGGAADPPLPPAAL